MTRSLCASVRRSISARRYKLLKKLRTTSDMISFNMIRKILEDEVKHEQYLEDLMGDIKLLGK